MMEREKEGEGNDGEGGREGGKVFSCMHSPFVGVGSLRPWALFICPWEDHRRPWVGANGGRRLSLMALVIGGWGVIVSMGACHSSMGDCCHG